MNEQKTIAVPRPAVWAQIRSLIVSAPAAIVAGFLVLTITTQVVIPLPFTPVPLSLGTLGAMLVGAFLGPWKGSSAAVLYAGAGAVGLPVFAGFQAGYQMASFGYVLGYIAAAGLMGFLVQRRTQVSYARGFLYAAAASAMVYVFGVVWMITFFSFSPLVALQLGVVPFLVGDLIKSSVVAGVIHVAKA